MGIVLDTRVDPGSRQGGFVILIVHRNGGSRHCTIDTAVIDFDINGAVAGSGGAGIDVLILGCQQHGLGLGPGSSRRCLR